MFEDEDWGLIVYAAVHRLPAPVFGATASIQGRRRLGLTATLVREDGREGDVFALVGPKRYDLPWQLLQQQGFIADTRCCEVRVGFKNGEAERYERANENEKFRSASNNPAKLTVIRDLLKRHSDDNVLVIGTYLDQLHRISRSCKAPLITGKTPTLSVKSYFTNFAMAKSKSWSSAKWPIFY